MFFYTNEMGRQMIKYIVITMLLISGCAPESGRHIRCAPFIKAGADGHRINGFMDLERDQEVDFSQCDEIIVE